MPWNLHHSPQAELEVQHMVPEAWPGKNLTKLEARNVASQVLLRQGIRIGSGDTHHRASASECAEVSEDAAFPKHLEQRTDMYFTFTCNGILKPYGLPPGTCYIG